MPDGLLRTAAEFRAGYADTLAAVTEMVDGMPAGGWVLPTGCPGWRVRDLVAHISSLEALLLGESFPSHVLPDGLDHVRSAWGQLMEVGVDVRRSWSIDELVDEYHRVTAARLRALDDIRDDQLDDVIEGFVAPWKLRSALMRRVFDIWSHEQDMRRALGREGGFTGPAGLHGRETLARGAANRVAERDVMPEETTLLLDITGPAPALRLARFSGGRGVVRDQAAEAGSDSPTVTLRLDIGTLAVLGCGRSDAPAARERVRIDGDRSLGHACLEDLAFTP